MSIYYDSDMLTRTIGPKKTISLARNDNDERVVVIKFPYDLDTLRMVRTIPGRKHHPQLDCWSVPLYEETVKDLVRWGFSKDEKLEHYLEKKNERKSQSITNSIKGLKGQLFPFQGIGVAEIEFRNGRTLLADEMGLGKAQPWDTKVLTTSGWKRMIDLTLKDLIFGSDGLPHKIKGIYNKGLKKVYKISFSDTSSVKCCEDHLWSVYSPRDKWMGWSNKVLPLKDIMKMELKTEKKSKANLLFIPILSAPINFPFKKLIIPPYTMGALLGDGGLLHGVCFSNTDKDIIKRVSNEIKNLGYSLRKIKGDNVDYRIIKTDQTHKTKKNKITAIIKKYKLNVKSIDKHIPKRYKFSSAEQRIQLLQGLMDTDGWASLKNGILQFSTTSVRLCNDVQFLIESLGGIAKKKGYDHNYIYKGKKRQAHKA